MPSARNLLSRRKVFVELLSNIATYIFFPVGYLLHPGTQYYWATYVGAGITAILIYALFKRKALLSITAAKNLVFPKRLFGHASTQLDLKLFFIGIYYLLLIPVDRYRIGLNRHNHPGKLDFWQCCFYSNGIILKHSRLF